jgi:hypothetical protein
MNKWLSGSLMAAIIALGFCLGAPLMAQGGGGGGKGNWGKGKQYKNPNGQGNGNGNNGQGSGQGNGQGNGKSDWEKDQEDHIGWGESGLDERVLPGDTVKDADKTTRLEAEADKLGLEDKKIRKDFIKYAKLGWDKAEKEDARWAKEAKKVKDNSEQFDKARDEHKKKLEEAWAGADESQVEKEVLTAEQLETFKDNTKDLREQSATDISMEQDKIRAAKVEEIKNKATEWNKEKDAENEVKKEKKDAESEDEAEEEKKD